MGASALKTKSGKRVACPITPEMIDATQYFYDAFGHMETEISAGWIVRFCQKRGHWGPFTRKEINDFYHEKRSHRGEFWFNRLISEGFIASQSGEDGPYEVTFEFVVSCYKSSPFVLDKE